MMGEKNNYKPQDPDQLSKETLEMVKRVRFFFFQHNVVIDIPRWMDFTIMCERKELERLETVCSIYGMYLGKPRPVMKNSEQVLLEANRECMDGVTAHLSIPVERMDRVLCDLTPLKGFGRLYAEDIHASLGRRICNVHRLVAAAAHYLVKSLDGQLPSSGLEADPSEGTACSDKKPTPLEGELVGEAEA